MPAGYPSQILVLVTHEGLLYRKYGKLRANGDQKWEDRNIDYLSGYQQAWNSPESPPGVRIRAAQNLAGILLILRKYEELNALLDDAIRLLPSISLHHLNPQVQQYILGEFTGLSTLAASTALEVLEDPKRALELLEQGRAVIARQRLAIRTALAAFKLQKPGKSEKPKCFNTFHGPPNGTLCSESPAGGNDKATQRQRIYQYFGAVNGGFKIPGFETFLLRIPANEFQAAASGGPVVVINVSHFRCDALLIRTDSIRLLPLPNLDYKVMRRMVDLFKTACVLINPFYYQNEILRVLEWLWDAVTSPILNELGFREPPREGSEWPRVWWIPTGLLGALPIHAAGRYKSTLSETVIDRVISSYSLSVNMLLCTQRQTTSYSRLPGEACVVSMMTTPGCSPLPTVGEEIEAIEALLPSPQVGPIRPLRNPRKTEVIKGLKTCDIFHFAGHGVLNPVDPTKSCLLLNDWEENPLTVGSIMNLNLGGNTPFLAYLSACSTGAGPAECLQDESINLMTAFQLAGVRHAVGSLWNLFKKYPAIAAFQFYTALRNGKPIDDNAVALAVHATARHIREITRSPDDSTHGAGDPLAWASYIHIGPYVVCF
ncbi:CHAT domain-containing protein [Xylaria grammica]|nr:CHAT domain-containing protein [Xylaria grammica]